MSRVLNRLPAFVAAAAYLAAAVGGTGLHELAGGGHAHCDHSHGEHGDCHPLLERAGRQRGCPHDHSHVHDGHRHGGNGHAHGNDSRTCGTETGEVSAERSGEEPDSPAPTHDPHHCAVCQFLAMGQQAAEAPRPVDVAGPTPSTAAELFPSVGSGPALTERVRGPPAAV